MLVLMESEEMQEHQEQRKIGLCSDRTIVVNLILMTVFWTTCSLDYYMILFFLKYLPGNIYINTTLSGLADTLAYGLSGFVMQKFGVKLAFMVSFILASCGGLLLIIFFQADGALIAVFVLFTKIGIALAFNLCYLAMPALFPPEIKATAFGVCNLFARFATIVSPEIAELPDPAPMSCFTITCIGAALLPLCLRSVKKEDKESEQ